MKKFLLIFLIPTLSFAQKTDIDGCVLSSNDNLPVSQVNISVQGTHTGTSTDENGKYILTDIQLPAVLTFSHVAFKKEKITLTKKHIKNGKINLNVLLKEKSTELDEFVVRSQKIYNLERLVYDFEIDSSNIYLLCNKKGKKSLQVYTYYDYMLRQQTVPDKINEISFDSRNNLRIRNKKENSYFLINPSDTNTVFCPYDSMINGLNRIIADDKYYKDNRLEQFSKYYLRHLNTTFPQILQHPGKFEYDWTCSWQRDLYYIGRTDNSVYFALFSLSGKYKGIFRVYIDKNDSPHYTLVYYTLANINDWLYARKNANPFANEYFDGESMDNLQYFSQSGQIRNEFLSKLGLSPVYDKKAIMSQNFNNHGRLSLYTAGKATHPTIFITTKHNFYIFNCEKSVIYCLDKNHRLIHQVTMDEKVKEDLHFCEEIIFDVSENRCFVRTLDFGITRLRELNLQTGKYTKLIKLLKPGIEKIRIAQDKLYFTAPLETNTGMERLLYVQSF